MRDKRLPNFIPKQIWTKHKKPALSKQHMGFVQVNQSVDFNQFHIIFQPWVWWYVFTTSFTPKTATQAKMPGKGMRTQRKMQTKKKKKKEWAARFSRRIWSRTPLMVGWQVFSFHLLAYLRKTCTCVSYRIINNDFKCKYISFRIKTSKGQYHQDQYPNPRSLFPHLQEATYIKPCNKTNILYLGKPWFYLIS